MNQNNSPTQETFSFPVGYHTFHKNKDINFQLNRFYSFCYWTKADAEEAGKSIREIGDWKLVLTGSAVKHKPKAVRYVLLPVGYLPPKSMPKTIVRWATSNWL